MSGPDRETPGVYRRPNGVVLHLYLPGYEQGSKPRSAVPEGLCAAQAWGSVWLDDVPPITPAAPFRWCGKCVGLALAKFGLLGPAIDAITPYFRAATELPQGATQRDGGPDRVADPRVSGGRQQPEELVPVAPLTEERGGVGSAPAPPAWPEIDFSRVSVPRHMLEGDCGGSLIDWLLAPADPDGGEG